jgi:hypothetical protein
MVDSETQSRVSQQLNFDLMNFDLVVDVINRICISRL